MISSSGKLPNAPRLEDRPTASRHLDRLDDGDNGAGAVTQQYHVSIQSKSVIETGLSLWTWFRYPLLLTPYSLAYTLRLRTVTNSVIYRMDLPGAPQTPDIGAINSTGRGTGRYVGLSFESSTVGTAAEIWRIQELITRTNHIRWSQATARMSNTTMIVSTLLKNLGSFIVKYIVS